MLTYNDQHPASHHVEAVLEDGALDDAAIRDLELHRSRRALAHLKDRIGNDRMKELLAADLDATTERVREWTRASDGAWQSGSLTLQVPGPDAEHFHAWFMGNMRRGYEALFRAGHPDHFMNHPTPGGAEVIENVGEDELPWHIFLTFHGSDTQFPTPWDPSYDTRFGFGALIRDRDGLRIGSAVHELRDGSTGALEVKLTIHLPTRAPSPFVLGHLRHFAIEFRNWTEMAVAGAGALDGAAPSVAVA